MAQRSLTPKNVTRVYVSMQLKRDNWFVLFVDQSAFHFFQVLYDNKGKNIVLLSNYESAHDK